MSEQVFTSCTQGGPVFIHVKDGKIIRVRPLVFGENEEVPTWTLKAGGRASASAPTSDRTPHPEGSPLPPTC